MNNKNAWIIGGIAVLILIGGMVWYGMSYGNVPSTTSTSTPVTTTTATADQTTAGDTRTPTAPAATTGNTVAPTDTTVVVSGSVTPNGALTSYWYEYGTTSNLGKKSISANVGSGFTTTAAPMYITGLTKDTTYYYRVVAENSLGSVTGDTHTFQTTHNVAAPVGGVPTIKSLAATEISSANANVNGQISANKSTTQYWFEYGTTATLGRTTPLGTVDVNGVNTAVQAQLQSLLPSTTYYFRLNAQNQFGTVNGGILTFKTSGPTVSVAAPVITTQVASPVAATSATLRATVNPYGTDATYWFEYSTNAKFTGNQTKTTAKQTTGAVSNTLSVQANVTGLQSKTTYYYRVVAQNASGTVRGDSETLKTQ